MLNIILLGLTSLLTDISSEMVYPILPVFLVSTLGASPAILGLIEGVAESSASLLKVFSGYFSDRFKSRKPFTIAGYAGSTIGKFFLFIASSWHSVFLGRLIDRFGKGVRTAPRDALIAESAQSGKKGAAFGLHRAMDTAGAAAGVMVAYVLITRSPDAIRSVFLFSLFPAALGVLFLFFVKEKKMPATARQEKIRFSFRQLDKKLRFFLIFTFIFTLGNSSNQFLLLRAQNLGNPLPRVILFYLVYNIIYALVSYPASRLSDKIGRKALLVLGYICYGLVYLGFAVNHNPFNFWLLFAFYGVYIGCTEGVEKALIADIAPADVRATTIGLHAALVGIGLLPASLLAGVLWKFSGPAAPFYFGGMMGILSGVGLWFILR
jgi:MFS family permease